MEGKRIIGVLLLLAGMFFAVNSQMNLTGAVTGAPGIPYSVNFLLGMSMIAASIVILAGGSLDDRMHPHGKYGSDVRAFRRWLSKKEGHEVPYEKAAAEYYRMEAKYNENVRTGRILRRDAEKDQGPLEYVEREYENLLPRPVPMSYISKKKREFLDNEAAILLGNHHVETRPKQLIRMGIRCGYAEGPHTGEGTVMLTKGGKKLTVIPKHGGDIGTSKGTMTAYATGVSSFREIARKK